MNPESVSGPASVVLPPAEMHPINPCRGPTLPLLVSAGPVEIANAVARLARGELVAFPTETVYGLGADATNAHAVARVFAAKGRPANNPLIVHVSGVPMARTAALWTPLADRLAHAFWPGPLTLVLPKSGTIPDIVTAGGPNVALRCPSHPITLALIETLGRPIVGPSANPSGRVSPTTAQHVLDSFAQTIEVLDGGPCQGGIESTVVSLAGTPMILRPGLVGAAELAAAAGVPVLSAANLVHHSADAAPSPGMLSQHYAPRASAFMMGPEHRAVVTSMLARPGLRPVAALFLDAPDLPAPHTTIRMPSMPAEYAAALYASLRQADAMDVAAILVERVPVGGDTIWTAVSDRLQRATATFSAEAFEASLRSHH